MNYRRFQALSLLALLMAGLVVFWPGKPAHAFAAGYTQPGFGMIGIAYKQAARLNVYVDSVDPNIFPPGPCTPVAGVAPSDSCAQGPWKVTLSVFNGDGSVLVQSVQTLGLKQVGSLDYAPTDLPFAPVRKRIRPVVTIEPDANGVVPCIKQAFELIDNDTQRTAITYAGQDNMMSNMPMRDLVTSFGVFDIGKGQTARLNVVNTEDMFNPSGFPPGPCRVSVNFYGSDGHLISALIGLLKPGGAGSLDFNFSSTGTGGGAGRAAIRAEVTVEPDANGVIPCIMPTLEIFDQITGKTTSLIAAS